jgi:hypothetical protein
MSNDARTIGECPRGAEVITERGQRVKVGRPTDFGWVLCVTENGNEIELAARCRIQTAAE